ncbi:MAG: galactokinase [Solirubrobacteraceae bacterium]|nr:galactokinase [Solirubrobacteraceae bacterium]
MSIHAAAFAPGRVNLIGEHTDYNDGLALPFAIRDGVTVKVAEIEAGRVEATASDLGERDEFPLAAPPPGDGWRAFVRGAVAELQRAGVTLPGVRIEISGTVAQGGGLSSSAALEVALALALVAISGQDGPGRVELARLCARIENDWAGAQTGLLDQLASLFGQPEQAMKIDFRTLEVTPVPLRLGSHRLVTLDSGEQHANAGSGYNERRAECARACERLGIASLRDATLDMARALPSPLAERATHVITENQRVESAVRALAERNVEALGEILNASHASLRDQYEVSTPAVESAVQRLLDAGAVGARIMGGGFGGHVLGLLAPGAVAPEDAIEVRPGPGAHVLA